MDLQNPSLVRCLLSLGANVNCFNYGGFTPYHLTYGRQSEEIRCELYEKTAQELRELPDSESDESDMEEANTSEDEVCTRFTADLDHQNGALGGPFLTFPLFLPAAVRRHKVWEVDGAPALSWWFEQAEKLLKGCLATAPHEGKASEPGPRSESRAPRMETKTVHVWSKVTAPAPKKLLYSKESFNILCGSKDVYILYIQRFIIFVLV